MPPLCIYSYRRVFTISHDVAVVLYLMANMSVFKTLAWDVGGGFNHNSTNYLAEKHDTGLELVIQMRTWQNGFRQFSVRGN